MQYAGMAIEQEGKKMRHEQIQPGQTLRLKPDRQAAYGRAGALVIVSSIGTRDGYKTPWIYSAAGAFKPSDFAGIAK